MTFDPKTLTPEERAECVRRVEGAIADLQTSVGNLETQKYYLLNPQEDPPTDVVFLPIIGFVDDDAGMVEGTPLRWEVGLYCLATALSEAEEHLDEAKYQLDYLMQVVAGREGFGYECREVVT